MVRADRRRRSAAGTSTRSRQPSASRCSPSATSLLCGYAISQLRFPGRRPLWWLILASFMVPTQALIINHFVLMASMGLLNTWAGIILPQLIHPVVIIVYKQFFDQVPRDFREAAVMDNASEWRSCSRVYMPMNWGVTTALVHRHLHLGLERLPLAVPRGDQDRDDDDHRRHHAGERRLRRLLRPASCRPRCLPACRSRSPTCCSSAA